MLVFWKEKKLSEEREFAKYLEKIEDPNYQGYVNQSLPENPTNLEKMKFRICKEIVIYKRNNHLNEEQIAKKIGLTIPEVKDILFSYINKFTLDRLTTYADKLFSPSYAEMHID